MIEINLIPKEYLKRSRSFSFGKAGTYTFAGAGVVAIVLTAVTLYQNGRISDLEEGIEKANRRASVLRQDIQLVDGLTDVKTKISKRMEAVDRLDRHRSSYVRVLEDLSKNVPEFVWLTNYTEIAPDVVKDKKPAGRGAKKDKKDKVPTSAQITANVKDLEIQGHTFTLNALASFMIKMMRSDYFDDVELVSSFEKTLDGEKAYLFVLTCKAHFLTNEDLRSLAADRKADKLAASGETSHKSLN